MYNLSSVLINKDDKTEVIRVFETFAGIGAQNKAIKNSKVNMKIVKTSEWDARAIIAYAQIHHKKEFDIELKKAIKMNIEDINQYLFEKTFSLNSKTPAHILRKNDNFKRNLYAANKVNKNDPDITKVNGMELRNIDLLTYSFPCQGLSIANMGRDQGIKTTSKSTSNLIWEIRRILLEAIDHKIKLPKYLLMENVKNLISKKHKKDYEKWISFLEEIGYSTGTTIVSGLEHGSLQKRKRVFALSVYKGKINNIVLKEMLDKYSKKLTIPQRKEKYFKILDSSNIKEIEMAIPNDTPSRIKMAKDNHNLANRAWRNNMEYTFNTLTTKQDRHPNIGMLKVKKQNGKLGNRFITPREAYLIMGFNNNDYSNVHYKYEEGLITKESLYRQAGNSIIVSLLEDIFKIIESIERGENE